MADQVWYDSMPHRERLLPFEPETNAPVPVDGGRVLRHHAQPDLGYPEGQRELLAGPQQPGADSLALVIRQHIERAQVETALLAVQDGLREAGRNRVRFGQEPARVLVGAVRRQDLG